MRMCAYVHVCMHEVCIRVCMAMMCVQHVYVLNFVYAYMYMTSSNCNVGRYVPILVSIACLLCTICRSTDLSALQECC